MITLSSATLISKTQIQTLRPEFAKRAYDWFVECVKNGVTVYIYEGLRTFERQDELYAIGRTQPGKIVTQAKAGQSFHNYGLAFDWVPLKRNDKVECMYDADWDNNDLYAKGAEIGLQFNFRSLLWETPHLEDANYKAWTELVV